MARARVEQVQCDRCARVFITPVSDVQKAGPEFYLKFQNEEFSYNDLCEKCLKTLSTLATTMKEWPKKLSQEFIGKVMDGEDERVPSMTPAPDYTPPKPHSKVAATK